MVSPENRQSTDVTCRDIKYEHVAFSYTPEVQILILDEATSAPDSILVVKDGVIAEQGDHESLLAKKGVYKELYETQFRQVLDMEGALDETQKSDYWGMVEEENNGF